MQRTRKAAQSLEPVATKKEAEVKTLLRRQPGQKKKKLAAELKTTSKLKAGLLAQNRGERKEMHREKQGRGVQVTRPRSQAPRAEDGPSTAAIAVTRVELWED